MGNFWGPIELSNLPFLLEVSLPERELTGTLEVYLSPAGPGLNSLPSCEGATREFVRAANAQMFTPSDHRTSMFLTSPMRGGQVGHLYLLFKIENLPLESITVFVALLAHLNLAQEPVNKVSISLMDYPMHGDSLVNSVPKSVIGRPEELPFAFLEPKTYAWRKPIDVWFEFCEPIRPNYVAKIEEITCLWGYLVAMGGFDLGMKNHEFIPEFGVLSHIEPNVLRYSKEFFDAPSCAANCIVNLAHGLEGVGTLRSVTIEQ